MVVLLRVVPLLVRSSSRQQDRLRPVEIFCSQVLHTFRRRGPVHGLVRTLWTDVFQRREVAVLLRRLRLRRAVSPADPECFLQAHVLVEYVARTLQEFRGVQWWCHLQAIVLRSPPPPVASSSWSSCGSWR